DGFFASIMTGFTLNYIIPFCLTLGGTNFHVGLLNGLAQLTGSIAQLETVSIVEYLKSRLKIIQVFVFLHGISFLVIPSILFFSSYLRIYWFIFLICIGTIFTSIATPAWLSLMSDTVEKEKYGEYFAWRGKVLGVVSLVASFIAGLFLGLIKDKLIGFIILFSLAGVARLISGYFIGKMEDIPIKITKEKQFNYWQFVRRLNESNFVKYVMFVGLLNFTVFICAPFFNVYMLKELNMSYYSYTLVTLSAAVSGLFFLPFFGRLSDRIGNVKIIKITALLIAFLPLLWIFSKNLIYLIIINAFAGYVWTGFNLTTINFIFDAASEEVRTRCVSYFNFTNGIFIFLGTILSGWIATYIPPLVANSKLLSLFTLSFVLRFLVVVFLSKQFKEVKKVESVEIKHLLLTVLGVKPVLDFSKDFFYPFFKKLNNK
ncbi:MAG: MFS transporter, partial [Endomicrobia bacterium]|nr:MFS transporter [Endomicrobiia bacterium]